MARLLDEAIREWSSTSCLPNPCGLGVWAYSCRIAGIPEPELPPHQDRADLVALLKPHGSLEGYARQLIASMGWPEVADPERGDCGVVEIAGMGATCAICLSGGPQGKWMAKGDGLVLITPAKKLFAWRVPQCLKPSPPQSLPQSE